MYKWPSPFLNIVLAFHPAQLARDLGKGLNFAASFQEGCKREELQDPGPHVLHFTAPRGRNTSLAF